MKLYLYNCTTAQMAAECGINASRTCPTDTLYYKYDILEEADVTLPEGFSLEKTQGDGEEIFFGNQPVSLSTAQLTDGSYATYLITTDGMILLHAWSYRPIPAQL